MPFSLRIPVVVLIALTLVSCRRDPNVAKKQYLESGNKYLDRGLFKQAAIQYQNAIKIDARYGPAYYKWAMIDLKVKPPQFGMAIKHFRRAVELLKDEQAYQEEYKDAMVKLADLDLVFLSKDDKDILKDDGDVQSYCDVLFKKDPNSFDGFRLSGDLDYHRYLQAGDAGTTVQQGYLNKAMDFYRKADAVKPGDAGVSMQMGTILETQKHYAEAEPYFRKVIDREKTSYQAYMALYRLYMMQQRTGDAEQLLKEAIQNNPKNYVYLERLAYHYGAMGRRDDMVSVLGQIKAHAKDFDLAYQVVGDFYQRTGDADSALREYREGIEKDPKRKATYQHDMIQVLLRQGKRAEAAEVNNEILKENPKDADAQSLSAHFLLDQGDVNNALLHLQALVTTSPENATAHYELGRAYVASGRPNSREAARQQFEKAIQLRQDLILPRLGLASLQVTHGEYQAALDSVQAILQRDPGNLGAKVIQSQAFLGQKKFGESDNLLAGMLKSNPGSPDVYYQAGSAALAEGKPDQAETAFRRAYELNPANTKSLLGMVDADIQEGKPEKAMALLESEAKKAPNRLDIPLLMGTTAQREGKYQDSLTYFTRVLNGLDKNSKTRADLYMQIALTDRLAGDRAAAVTNLQKAREILPDNEIVLANLGKVLEQAGRPAEARQAYEACLRVNPNNVEVLNNLAWLMAESSSDLELALNYAEKAKGISPNTPEIADTYGWILLKKGLPDQSIPVFQDLVSRVPANATYHYHLAKAYAQKGDNAKASPELREALKHSPTHEEQQEIQDLLGKVGGK